VRYSLAIALAVCVALFLCGGAGFGVALRAGVLPSFDLHLTLDGRHALVIHHALPCTPNEPPQSECTASEIRREFAVIYSTLQGDYVLVTLALPEPP
jgi:hypothetical protein